MNNCLKSDKDCMCDPPALNFNDIFFIKHKGSSAYFLCKTINKQKRNIRLCDECCRMKTIHDGKPISTNFWINKALKTMKILNFLFNFNYLHKGP